VLQLFIACKKLGIKRRLFSKSGNSFIASVY
jgi:hypothetical protein